MIVFSLKSGVGLAHKKVFLTNIARIQHLINRQI